MAMSVAVAARVCMMRSHPEIQILETALETCRFVFLEEFAWDVLLERAKVQRARRHVTAESTAVGMQMR